MAGAGAGTANRRPGGSGLRPRAGIIAAGADVLVMDDGYFHIVRLARTIDS